MLDLFIPFSLFSFLFLPLTYHDACPASRWVFFVVALRPRKRDGLLGTGTEWEGDDRVKARPRKPPEKDRRDRGPPPERWKCSGAVPSPLPSDLCTAQLLFQLMCLDSHKDNVRCTAVDEQLGQLEAKEVQLAQPSSISLLMISSGLT